MSDLDRAIDHLSRYPSVYHDALAAIVVVSPRVAQLANSYPLLFLLLATGYASLADRQRAIAAADDGRPLQDIADALSLPLCLRKVAPEACVHLPFAAWSREASRELGGMIPKTPEATACWLKAIFQGHADCDEAFALWLARQRLLFSGTSLPEHALRALATYAWCSRFSPLPLSQPLSVPWQPDYGLDAACARAGHWAREMAIVTDLGPEGLADPWISPAVVMGFTFRPILTPEALIDEARVMVNCVAGYSDRLARGGTRLFSMLSRDRHVATVEVAWQGPNPQYVINEMRGPRNVSCPEDAVRAAYEWVRRHAPPHGPGPLKEPNRRMTLIGALLAPYCAAHPAVTAESARNAITLLLQADLVRTELRLSMRSKAS
jgi:hypothetical protein